MCGSTNHSRSYTPTVGKERKRKEENFGCLW
jgi:hypothetical protein